MGEVMRDLESMAPTLLVSMPQLEDPNFRRSVVLLCQHSMEGAWGLVINRPTGQLAAEVVQMDPPLTRDSGLEIWVGGPVEPQRGCILTTQELNEDEGIRLADGLYLSGSPALLRRLIEGKPFSQELPYQGRYPEDKGTWRIEIRPKAKAGAGS